MTLSFSLAERGLAMEVTGGARRVTRRNTGTWLAFVRGPGNPLHRGKLIGENRVAF
jgi:hypothetical protein